MSSVRLFSNRFTASASRSDVFILRSIPDGACLSLTPAKLISHIKFRDIFEEVLIGRDATRCQQTL